MGHEDLFWFRWVLYVLCMKICIAHKPSAMFRIQQRRYVNVMVRGAYPLYSWRQGYIQSPYWVGLRWISQSVITLSQSSQFSMYSLFFVPRRVKLDHPCGACYSLGEGNNQGLGPMYSSVRGWRFSPNVLVFFESLGMQHPCIIVIPTLEQHTSGYSGVSRQKLDTLSIHNQCVVMWGKFCVSVINT